MKAIIYARYSSDSQREASIDGQLRECSVGSAHSSAHYIRCAVRFANLAEARGKKARLLRRRIISPSSDRISTAPCPQRWTTALIFSG
jgi:hypothetical protein